MIGQQLAGRYQVLRPLARGGMGVVYVAHDPLLDREVAVKVVSPEFLTPETEQRFLREARLVARLDHPGVVAIHDFGRQDGALFFVMPLLKGESLRAVLGRRRLSVRETVEIGIQVAEALEHSHEAGVVHRDVKPENVMVLREGGALRAKVMDFGIALSSSSTRMTLAGSVFGTLAYLAPEQLAGGGVDGRTDVYALGVVLYECLAGQPPFSGDVQTVLFSIAHEAPPPPSAAGVEVDAELERLVMRCLGKTPAERPASATEVAEALARCRPQASDVAAPAAARTRARLATEAPLVGRDAALAEITQRLERARDGECHLVLVGGEPGMGKSRLLAEAERVAALRGARVLHGRFLERHDAAFPYHGFGEALVEAVRRARAAAEPEPLTGDLRDRLGPLFPALLDSDALPTRPDPAAPAASRADVFELLASAFARLAARAPLVLLLEDLHEADVSLDALQYLRRRLAGAPILVVGTYRSNELTPDHELRRLARGAERDARCAHLLLGPLAVPDRERLLALLLHGQELPADVARQVCEASEGNPFFMGELLRTLLAEGRLVQDASGAWTGVRGDSSLYAVLPGSLQQVVARRVEALGAGERELLEHASVLGRSFAEDELHFLGEVPEAALDELLASRYLEEERARPGRFSFTSALLREVVYASIPARRRRALHRRCAEQMEERGSGREPSAGRLAQHYAAAGLPDRAAPLALRAAERALAAGLPDDAARFASLAVQCAEDEAWSATPAFAAAARVGLARALVLAGQAERAMAELACALEAPSLPAAPRLQILLTAARLAWDDRRVEQARGWADEAAELARDAGDAAAGAALRQILDDIAERGAVRDPAQSGTADLPAPASEGEWLARGEYLAARDALRSARDGQAAPEVEGAWLERLADLAQAQGRIAEALEHLRNAARAMTAPGHAGRLALVEARASLVCVELGALEDAQLWLERAQARVDGGEAHGPDLLGLIAAARADVFSAAGDARAALDAARAGLTTCASGQTGALQARLLEAAVAAGATEQAEATARELRRAAVTGVTADEARRCESLALFHLAWGAPDEAAQAAADGVAVAESAGDPCWRARGQVMAAAADLARHAPEEAEERLLRATRDAERTRALPTLLAAQVGLAHVALAQGRVLAAEVAARLAVELAEPSGLAVIAARARLALAAALAPAQAEAARGEIATVIAFAQRHRHVALELAALETAARAELERDDSPALLARAAGAPPRRRAAARLLVARAATGEAVLSEATAALREALADGDLRTARTAHHLIADVQQDRAPDEALHHARVADELAAALGPAAVRERSASALALARAQQAVGARAAAAAALGQGLAAAKQARSAAVLARAHLQAATALDRRDPDRASALLSEARRLAAAVDVPDVEWRACRQAAVLALRLGRLDEAVDNLRRETAVRERAGLPPADVEARRLMASAYHALGDLAEAQRLLGEDPASSSAPLELLRARVLLDIGLLGPAAAALERVPADAGPDRGLCAARLALWDGDVGLAMAEIDEARRAVGDPADHDLSRGRLREQLRVAAAQAALRGDFPEAALAPAEEARRWLDEAGCVLEAAEAALVLAEARARTGRGDPEEPLAAAEQVAERLGLEGLRADARLVRARVLRRVALADEAYDLALAMSSLTRVAQAAQVAADLRAETGDGALADWRALAECAFEQLGQSRLAPTRVSLGYWGLRAAPREGLSTLA